MGQATREVLHRPFEPARQIRHLELNSWRDDFRVARYRSIDKVRLG